MAMVKWLCGKFPSYEIERDVMSETATPSSIEILQFFYEVDREIHHLGGQGHPIDWGGHTMSNAILAGRNDAAWWLYQNIPDANFALGAAFSAAIRKGEIVMAEWLIECNAHDVPDTASHDLMHTAAAQGRTDIVKWLAEGVGFDEGTLVVAAWRGHLRLVRWLMDPDLSCMFVRNHPPIKGANHEAKFAIHAAAVNGHLELAKYLQEETMKMSKWASYSAGGNTRLLNKVSADLSPPYEAAVVSAKTMVGAAKNGHIEVVKWLYEEFGNDPNVDVFKVKGTEGEMTAMDAAASNGHLDVLKYLNVLQLSLSTSASKRKRGVVDKRAIPTCTKEAMDGAAANGYLAVLQWLNVHRTEGCTTRAMDGAAKQGNLYVARWLYENRSEGCSAAAMDDAAANGHLQMVQWLHKSVNANFTTKAMDRAAQNGHLEAVKWLSTNRVEGCTSDAMDGAAERGFLNVVKWLHLHRTEGCTTRAMDSAASERHFNVVQWLHMHRSEGCSHSGIDCAALSGSFEVFLFVHFKCGGTCTVKTALTARDNRSPDIYRWILDKHPELHAEIEAISE